MSTSTEIIAVHEALVKTVRLGKAKPYEFRANQLKGLKRFFAENGNLLREALKSDLRRSDFEGFGVEIATTALEVDLAISNLKDWMKPVETAVAALFAPAKSEIHYEPFGLCLIVGAFNYPITLTIGPLIGAIAAGNCAIIKPSELSPATEQVFVRLLHKYLDPDCYRVVTGSIPEMTTILSLRFDKIFFTGSTRVGKIVMKAAAEFLTPVSLELGGKSPTIVDEHVTSLDVVVSRILWGKGVNCGQTCIAPDYIYCHEKHYDQFLSMLKEKITQFYGADVQKSPDLARIVNKTHFQRLKGLMEASKDNIYCGGKHDESEKFIEPTVFTNLTKDSKLMQEEIFGPLLPVFKYKDVQEVIEYVNSGEKPLTMYIFSNRQKFIDRLINDVSTGSVVVNDVLYQFGNLNAPVGGVGASGMGSYKGFYSFECFSHRRQVLSRNAMKMLDIPLRYPPYSKFALDAFVMGFKIPDIPPTRVLMRNTVVLGIIALGVVAGLRIFHQI